MAEDRYRVGAAARAAGVNVQTLHYYERRGLVAPRDRSLAGYREYGASEVRRVRAIKRAQSLGFTLSEIGDLIAIADGRRSSRTVGALAEHKLAEIDDKLRALRRMRSALRDALETCRCGGELSRCDVLEGLAEPRTPPVPEKPRGRTA